MIVINTQRTRIRLIELSDLEAIHQLHSLPEIDRFNTLGIPNNLEETKGIVEKWIEEHHLTDIRNYTFAIEDTKQGSFIGLFGIKLADKKFKLGEVWYKLLPTFWGKGIATEVLENMIDFGFNQLNLHRIQAGCAVDNVASIRVLEKAGLTREGIGRKILPLKSGWSDNYTYSILETDERK